MTDTAVGFLLLGIGLLVVLGVVFAIASRGGASGEREPVIPPRGVHLPGPSFLPVLLAVASTLLGAGFAFRGPWVPANPFLAVPGLLLLIASVFGWVRAANHEWREVEHRSHDDAHGAA